MKAPEQDYLKVLGLSHAANLADIKKAFRKLAKEHHPDKKGSDKRFAEIRHAYEELLQSPRYSSTVVSDVHAEQVKYTRSNASGDTDLWAFERRARAEGCGKCHGLGYKTINTDPEGGFMGLEQVDCSCQHIGIE